MWMHITIFVAMQVTPQDGCNAPRNESNASRPSSSLDIPRVRHYLPSSWESLYRRIRGWSTKTKTTAGGGHWAIIAAAFRHRFFRVYQSVDFQDREIYEHVVFCSAIRTKKCFYRFLPPIAGWTPSGSWRLWVYRNLLIINVFMCLDVGHQNFLLQSIIPKTWYWINRRVV